MNEPLASIRAHRDPGGVVTVTVAGEVDASNAEEVRRACVDHMHGAREAVLDLAAVRYLDSAGLRLLVALWQHGRSTGTRLRVSAPRGGFVAELLAITGLDAELTSPDGQST